MKIEKEHSETVEFLERVIGELRTQLATVQAQLAAAREVLEKYHSMMPTPESAAALHPAPVEQPPSVARECKHMAADGYCVVCDSKPSTPADGGKEK